MERGRGREGRGGREGGKERGERILAQKNCLWEESILQLAKIQAIDDVYSTTKKEPTTVPSLLSVWL